MTSRLSRTRSGELLQFGFNLGATTPVSCTLTEYNATVPTTASRAITISGSFFYCVAGAVTASNITFFNNFTAEVGNVLTALSPKSRVYSCSFNPASGYITVTSNEPSGSFRLDVKSGISQQVLGMSGNQQSTSTGTRTITGSWMPFYVWKSANPAKSKWKKPYEPKAMWTDNISDDGTCYPFGKESGEVISSWNYDFETLSHTRQAYYTQTSGVFEPWTYDLMLDHAGSAMPFVLHTSSLVRNPNIASSSISWANKEGVYRFTAEGARFNPTNIEANRQEWFSLPFNCRVVFMGSGSQTAFVM